MKILIYVELFFSDDLCRIVYQSTNSVYVVRNFLSYALGRKNVVKMFSFLHVLSKERKLNSGSKPLLVIFGKK